MVLNDENKEIIERNRVEHDCMCKVLFRIRGNVRYIHTYIHTYIRLLTTSPKGLFSANYKGKDKNENIYK